ncbi:MAG TPA: hypothetical protein VFR81_11200 [Longimicrobium sp.]|nr:hypothetical protein [Longimicrobium sp.]
MEFFIIIGGIMIAAKLAEGVSDIMKGYANRLQRGGDPREMERLRDEVRALTDRLEVTERAALSADEKVRFMERLLSAPAPSPSAATPPIEAPRSPHLPPRA